MLARYRAAGLESDLAPKVRRVRGIVRGIERLEARERDRRNELLSETLRITKRYLDAPPTAQREYAWRHHLPLKDKPASRLLRWLAPMLTGPTRSNYARAVQRA